VGAVGFVSTEGAIVGAVVGALWMEQELNFVAPLRGAASPVEKSAELSLVSALKLKYIGMIQIKITVSKSRRL
jgi:hypothetical protein